MNEWMNEWMNTDTSLWLVTTEECDWTTSFRHWMNEWTDTSLRYRHWRMCFERLLQAFARWQPGVLFDIAAQAQPILEYHELIVIHNRPCEHSSKLQLSIRFTPSRCLDVRQDWYPMYHPEGMKARVSPVQSIEPHWILAPTRDSDQLGTSGSTVQSSNHYTTAAHIVKMLAIHRICFGCTAAHPRCVSIIHNCRTAHTVLSCKCLILGCDNACFQLFVWQ